uniref:EF-hand domain-containing protein n=1 Tax=Zooxanthella nutricula TaxID=1333877 RepID=A0A7S2JX14_9DINO
MIKVCRQDLGVAEFFGIPSTIRQEDGSRDTFEQVFQGIDDNDDRMISFEELRGWQRARRRSGVGVNAPGSGTSAPSAALGAAAPAAATGHDAAPVTQCAIAAAPEVVESHADILRADIEREMLERRKEFQSMKSEFQEFVHTQVLEMVAEAKDQLASGVKAAQDECRTVGTQLQGLQTQLSELKVSQEELVRKVQEERA